MIKNLFRITLASYIWKQYKAIIISTLILFVYFWLVGKLHADFISYSELNNDKRYIGASFIVKWLLFIFGVIFYFFVNVRYSDSKGNKQGKEDKYGKENPESSINTFGINKNNSPDLQSNTKSPTSKDPFEEIRRKNKLKSSADIIIEKNKK